MASRMTKWLFPNRSVYDDTGYPREVTGRLATQSLELTGFDPYRSDDSKLKKVFFFSITLISLAGAILVMDHISAISNKIGCWSVPIAFFLIFAIFHQLRMRFGRRSDEEILQQSIPAYREANPGLCPACDGELSPPVSGQLRICIECKGEWLEKHA